MKTIFRNSIYFLCACILFAACDRNCLSEQTATIPQTAWHQDSAACVLIPIHDTLSHCGIILTFRHNDDYPWNNIILSITAKSPSGAVMRDTVEYRLTDEKEIWNGKKSGKWIDHRLAFRTDVQFLQSGDYEFSIAHLMRDVQQPNATPVILKGVGAVGVRIEKATAWE